MSSGAPAVPARLARDMASALDHSPNHDTVDTGLALLRSVEERRDREAAFLLLAADALLTKACEEASTAVEPEQVLDSVLTRVAEALG